MLLFVPIFLSLAKVIYGSPILGGNDAPDGKYPYMVSIRFHNVHSCGGSILNKRWILTAAHCLIGFEDIPLEVVVGTNLLRGGDGQTYDKEYQIIHKKYNKPIRHNDIGMIRVNRNIRFNDKVQPIALPKFESKKDGDSVKLTGWGIIKRDGTYSNKLQEINLKVFNREQCKKEMFDFANINNSHICTLTKAGEGSCKRDSGGPLVANGVQIGIVSFADPHCANGKPDVFTRVYSFLGWIATQQTKF